MTQLDVPAFDWPAATFPLLKYPLADHAAENAEIEARALAEVEETIKAWSKTKPIAALVIEPIQSGPCFLLTSILTSSLEGFCVRQREEIIMRRRLSSTR